MKTKVALLDGVFTVHARNKNIHLFLVHGKTKVWLNGTSILSVQFAINVTDIWENSILGMAPNLPGEPKAYKY